MGILGPSPGYSDSGDLGWGGCLTKIPYGSATKGLRPHLGTHCSWGSMCIREDGGSYQEWEKAGRTRQRDISADFGLPSSPPLAAHFRPPQPPRVRSSPCRGGSRDKWTSRDRTGHPLENQEVPALISPLHSQQKKYMHF